MALMVNVASLQMAFLWALWTASEEHEILVAIKVPALKAGIVMLQ